MISQREVNALLGPDNPATMTTDIDMQLITEYDTLRYSRSGYEFTGFSNPEDLWNLSLWRLLTRTTK